MRTAVTVGVLTFAIASVWYLIAPPRTADAYRDRAVHTLESVRSQVQTARLWLLELEDGHVTEAATTVALEETDDGASGAASSFAALDPPAGTTAIHDAVTAAVSASSEQLTRLRIAAHAGNWSGALTAQGRLAALAGELQRVAGEVHR